MSRRHGSEILDHVQGAQTWLGMGGMCQRWGVEETVGLCDQQGEERLREWVMVLELEWGQIGSLKVWVWEVSLALRYPRVVLAAESVDLGLGEDQAGHGGLGTPAAVVLSGYSMEVTNPHRWDPQDLYPRV